MLYRPVFINAISLPHLIIEIEMKIYNKNTALAMGLCGVFATLPAVAALQSFEVDNNNDVKCGYKNDNGLCYMTQDKRYALYCDIEVDDVVNVTEGDIIIQIQGIYHSDDIDGISKQLSKQLNRNVVVVVIPPQNNV